MSKRVLILACATVLLLATADTRATAQGAPATPEAKPASPEAKPATPEAKPEGEGTKPEDTAPSAPTESTETEPANGEPVSLGELTRDGFEIRTTDFIPAEAVTRQSGKVSSDAIVVTLQKTSSTAVCFYTLKAYVGKKLTTIPACTVHR